MSAPCPKCGHVRLTEDTAPDYECPRCGVVYAKYLAELHKRAAATQDLPASPEKQNHLSPLQAAAGVLLAVGVIWYISHRHTQIEAAQSPKASTPPASARPASSTPPTPTKQQTPEQLERERINKLELAAREVCFDAIRAKALFPSSVDIAWFTGTVTVREEHATLVKAAFTAKNELGNDLPFYGYCRVADTGALQSYSQTPR